MIFPSWELHGVSGGFLIAAISVIHVFVAQFAVGGGFFLVAAENLAERERSVALMDWTERHAKFFQLLTMVFGGLSGVAIWVVISLTAPAATSVLVRHFLFAWATEWCFFAGEIIALLFYVAGFAKVRSGAMDHATHKVFGKAYAAFAFLSLFVINGIVSFMLTPGQWLVTQNFWDGLFNPTFWPALVFRFLLCLALAGVFGLFTAWRIREADDRQRAVQRCAGWLCLPALLLIPAAWWYYEALPAEIQANILRYTADIKPFLRAFMDSLPVLLLAGILLFIRLPKKTLVAAVPVLTILALLTAGSFEFIREAARRPWVIHGYMYSNGITKELGQELDAKGVLAVSGWAGLRAAGAETKTPLNLEKLTPEQKTAFAGYLFAMQCSACHGEDGPMLTITKRVAGLPPAGVEAIIAGQGKLAWYMPPFFGLPEERHILAEYLVGLAAGQEQGNAAKLLSAEGGPHP